MQRWLWAYILGIEIDDHYISRYAGYSVPFGACPEAEKNRGKKEGEVEKPTHLGFGETFGTQVSFEFEGDLPRLRLASR